MSSRATYLLMSDMQLLEAWGREVRRMFNDDVSGLDMPYLVGSALTTKDYRDVDVRLIVHDDRFKALAEMVDLPRLHLALSLWGQKATGLPIDFQLQSMTDANVPEHGRRQPIGMRAER